MATTAAGSALAISAVLPSRADLLGYATLTYLDIGGLEKIGTYGGTPATVSYQPLRGARQKRKGPTDFGGLQPKLAPDYADAGQALLAVAAAEKRRQFAFRIMLSDGGIRYFQGRVFDFLEAVENAESILHVTGRVEINTPIVKATAAQPLPDGYAFVTTNDGVEGVTTSDGFELVTTRVN
ncbi:hypothetical protein [Sphingomonas mucosissima]|uniref:Phage tail protein n=1 Tax=Sphingomonas mucosissima TaxID=370959 RepID=A0A245ZRD2_9SPHN|nr:hypothetical protein [Sphingomonas mucosissima]OWK32303.1 hypothetical protein SPMU_06250 [Sphingomonas mucosissima]